MARTLTARQSLHWPAYLTFDRSSGGIAALDGLWATAILLVLGRHAVMPFRADGGRAFEILGWQDATPLVNGWIGVDLFFALSGFLISHGIIRRKDNFRLGGLVLTPLAFRLNLIAGGAEIADYETFFRTLRSPFHQAFDGLAAGMLVALLWRDRDRWRWMADPRAGAAIFWAGVAAIGW